MRSLLVVVLLGGSAISASTSPKSFNFNNQTFGGNPLASNHFWKSAEKQYEPEPLPEPEPVSELEKFADQLRSRTLSSISSALASKLRNISLDEVSGDGSPQQIEVDGINIEYFTDGEDLIVDLLNEDTGERIRLEIPNL